MTFQKLTVVFLSLACFLTSFGNTITVTSNADNGAGSLREAITTANSNGSAVTGGIYIREVLQVLLF